MVRQAHGAAVRTWIPIAMVSHKGARDSRQGSVGDGSGVIHWAALGVKPGNARGYPCLSAVAPLPG
jgi:hypothetical protein